MEEIIDNLFKEFSFDSYVCGFHLHEDIWNSRIVEDCLKRPHGKGNEHGDFAIGVYRNNEIKEKIVEHFTCLKQYLNLSNFCDQNFILRSRKSMWTEVQALGLRFPLNIHFTNTKRLLLRFRKRRKRKQTIWITRKKTP